MSACAMTIFFWDRSRLLFGGSRRAGLGVFLRAAWLLFIHHIATACTAARRGGGARSGRRAGAGAEKGASASGHTTGERGYFRGPIRVWIVGATGFRQDYDRVTGLELLWRKLRGLSRADVCVTTPQKWNEDPEAMAAYIARNSDGKPDVLFYGYSYGVGHFFIRFARALQRYDIIVHQAVLCDGIRRFRFAKPVSFRFFRAAVAIPVPDNVEEVDAYYQTEDPLLRGHDLVAEDDASTTIRMKRLDGYNHLTIDEAWPFHGCVLHEAQRIIQSTN